MKVYVREIHLHEVDREDLQYLIKKDKVRQKMEEDLDCYGASDMVFFLEPLDLSEYSNYAMVLYEISKKPFY